MSPESDFPGTNSEKSVSQYMHYVLVQILKTHFTQSKIVLLIQILKSQCPSICTM